MVANRYGEDRRLNRASLAAALLINGGMLAALLLAAPEIIVKPPIDILTLLPITEPVPPPPEPAKPIAKTNPAPKPTPVIPKTLVPDPTPTVDLTLTGANKVEVDLVDGSGGIGKAIDPPAPPPPLPVFIEPEFDQRYARGFQPDYPAAERRLGREGSVAVRVLIGTDGRVKQVERQSATSDDFFAATQRTALSQWRFRPATRDGVPIERWKTLRVTFRLEDA